MVAAVEDAVGRRTVHAGGQAFQQQQVRPDFYFYDANVRASYRPSNSDFVVLSLYGGRDDLDNSRQTVRTVGPQGTAQRSVFSDVVDVTDWGNLGASIMWSRAWAPRHQTQLQFAGSRYDSDFNRTNATEVVDPQLDSVLNVFSTANVESNRVEDFTARLDHVWDLAAAHRVRLGVWAARQETDYAFTRDTTTLLSTAAQGTRVEFYAEDTWSPSRRFTLTLGGRASRYDATAEWYLEPRLAAGFRVLPNLRIKAAFGEYHQFVNRVVRDNVTQGSRDFWLLADANLIPIQSARHWIAGVTWNAGGTVLDVEAYHRDLSGLSEFSLRFRPNEGFAIEDLFHDGMGVARGLEVLAQRRWGTLTGWVSYTLAEVEHTFPTINGGLPFAALHDQRHELKTVASLNLGRFVLSATWAYGSGRPYTSPESQYTITLLDGTEQSYIHVGEKNSQRLPAYHRMDAAIHYRFDIAAGAGRGDISLSAFNVYNRRNVWYREFDLSDTPILITDVNYLGFTPNISFRMEF